MGSRHKRAQNNTAFRLGKNLRQNPCMVKVLIRNGN